MSKNPIKTRFQWLIPTLAIRENEPAQAEADRDRQLAKAQEQRQRRAERNIKLVKAR